jgi:two-component system sensor kinase FixL
VRREDVRRSLRAKTAAVLLRRLRIALGLTLASYGLYLVNDIGHGDPNLTVLLWIKVVQIAGVASVLVFLASARAARHIVGVALGVMLFVTVAATVSAIVRGNVSAHILLLVAVTVGTATMYPWGARAQAVLVASCLLLMSWAFQAVEGSALAILAHPSMAALLAAVVISLYLARDSERYRWQIEERELGLRMREEHFRTLLESAADLIVLLDAGGRVRSVSPAIRSLLGYAAKQWIGASLFELVHPDDVATLREAVAASRSSSAPLTAEIRIRDAGSTWRVFLVTIADLLGHAAVEGIVLHARDISARKAMEVELRRSEAALSALIESTSDSVWSVDRERRLTAMNAAVRGAFADQFGIDVRIGQTFEDRVPPEIAARWRELYDRALAGERVTSEQSFARDGEMRHYLISMNPTRDHGEITGAVVFSREITELRRAAELARRNQAELTHVLRLGTIGEMASGLAHEINQPLGAIANYAAACKLRLDTGALSRSDLRRGLELISCEALRAGEIIRRLRDLARKGEVSMEMADPAAVVHSAVALVEPEARLQGISVRVETARDLPRLYVDPIQVEQVILNLLLNAIEAVQGSAIKRMVIESRRVNGYVEISVRDTGIGLPEEISAHLFEPFYTTKPQGLGMGLAISRRIVEAHGGRLTAAANGDGCGSVFRFTLPLPQ